MNNRVITLDDGSQVIVSDFPGQVEVHFSDATKVEALTPAQHAKLEKKLTGKAQRPNPTSKHVDAPH